MATSQSGRGFCLAGLHLTLLLRGPGQARHCCQGTGHHHRPSGRSCCGLTVRRRANPGGCSTVRPRPNWQPGDAGTRPGRRAGHAPSAVVAQHPLRSGGHLCTPRSRALTTASTTWPLRCLLGRERRPGQPGSHQGPCREAPGWTGRSWGLVSNRATTGMRCWSPTRRPAPAASAARPPTSSAGGASSVTSSVDELKTIIEAVGR